MKTKIILIFLLILSVTGLLVIYTATKRAYDQYNDLRLDPIGLDDKTKFEFEEKEYDIVLLGDSHAANWVMKNINMLNLGIPSQTSNQILIRSDMIKDKLKGKKLLIITGANDIKSILTNKPLKESIVDKCKMNIEKIVLNHKSMFENIFVMTVPPIFKVPKEYFTLWDKSIVMALDDLNEGIKTYCEVDSNVNLLDANAILKEKMKSEKLSSDGVHLNMKGYEYLNQLLEKEKQEAKSVCEGKE